jgi:biotin carboxylase
MRALSIGAGLEQQSAIAIAESLGIKVLALDGNSNADGAKIASQFIRMDLMDADNILQITKKFQPDFLLPVPIARPLITAGIINDTFGLKGVSEFAARLANDKRKMHIEFTRNGVPMARQILVKNAVDIRNAISHLGLPLILKPRSGSGSRGVILLDNETVVPSLIGNEDWVIEEALNGREVGIDGALVSSKLILYALRFKRLTSPPYRQAISYFAKDPIGEQCFSEISEVVQRALTTLECNNVLFHADMIIDEAGGIKLIELSPRPSGHSIHSALLPICFGDNLIKDFILRTYLRRMLPPPRFQRPAFMSFLPLMAPGRVVTPPLFEESVLTRGTISVSCRLKAGDKLGPMIDGHSASQRGYVTVSTNCEAQGIQVAKQVADTALIESIEL